MPSPSTRIAHIALAILFAACAREITVGRVEPITASSTGAWSDGSVDLYSPAFVGLDTLPRVRVLGGKPLTVTVADAYVVRVRIPAMDGGVLDLVVQMADGSESTPISVRVPGFRRQFDGASLAGLPQRIAGTALLLGNGEHGLVRYDARTGYAFRMLDDSLNDPPCTLGTGLSLVPGLLTASRERPGSVNGISCRFYARAIGAAPVDSSNFGFAWAVVHAGPGRWILNTKHMTVLCNASTCTQDILEEPDEFEVDFNNTLVVPELAYARAGIPVYDAATVTVRYRLPIVENDATGFSLSGDTLFVTGMDSTFSTERIIAVRAADGTVLRSGTLGFHPYGMVAVEPDRPWLYYPVVDSTYRPEIRVVDRRTLAEAGRVRATASTLALAFPFEDLLPVLDPGARRLYLVEVRAFYAPARPTRIYEFDLVP